MRAFRCLAVSVSASAVALSCATTASAEIYQVERAMRCQTQSCIIDDIPAVPAGKRLFLQKLSCELYAIKTNTINVRASFYIYGQDGKNFTPRHRFISGYFFDGSAGDNRFSYTTGLSETPTLELRAGYKPVIAAGGDWVSASGACTLVGDLTKK